MAQRDKVKELVGRGLNSYHTKALQQIDRIKKKNKEQSHKISILSNELDNDYLTKTEEGSVISLDYSKEGMVYLDELQGNTMVNYCTDGSKELTLNGDIDVEGTFVTTTEGVDNGLIDVMCEGHTLVNLGGKVNKQSNRYGLLLKSTMILKPSTLYTFIVTNLSNQSVQFYRNESVFNAITDRSKVVPANSTIVFTWTTLDTLTDDGLIKSEMDNATQFTLDVVVLEGDWTNRELPTSYFEGMKSVGQDDVNGHKIEILSKNKNLFDGIWEIGTINSSTGELTDVNSEIRSVNFMSVKQGQSLTFSYPSEKNLAIRMYDKNKKYLGATELFTPSGSVYNGHTRIVPNNVHYMKFKIIETDLDFQLQVENGSNATEFKTQQLNKKEILINEPLRGLPNGIKDRFVKLDSKWYIERNCKEIVLNGSEDWVLGSWDNNSIISFNLLLPGSVTSWKNDSRLCDKFVTVKYSDIPSDKAQIIECITGAENYIYLAINKTKLEELNVDSLKKYLISNNIRYVYQLENPTYEPLALEPTLTNYTDITHISNNSIIPCNMKIQNSGYNAIIKPSTLYTIALDTNKSGTIGMNLGGAKGVTTNNVLTLTTPAILADDSLRIYGKGIKGSKIRLLEGDKTNWIPSFFEGMKSSFEDKLQDDGTYKMEILSNDISLFDIHERNFYLGSGASNLTVNGRKIEYDANDNYKYLRYDRFNFVRGKKYTIVIKGNNSRVLYFNNNNLSATGITSNNTRYVTFVAGHNAYTTGIENGERGACKVTIEDVWIYEGDYDESKHTTTKHNKIQFSSIEPLRKWDRFVFKDNNLVIERGSLSFTVDNSRTWTYDTSIASPYYKCDIKDIIGAITQDIAINNILCDKLPIKQVYTSNSNYGAYVVNGSGLRIRIEGFTSKEQYDTWLATNPLSIICTTTTEPTYEEIPFELQKIILEGYENGTLFFDTNIPPTSTVAYAGETPIVKATKLNKTEVLNNTNDINDNIVPYLMDMDYRVVCLQLENGTESVSMARLFGGSYEMLKRDILSKRLTKEEYGCRITDYFNAGKLTEKEVRELEDIINE